MKSVDPTIRPVKLDLYVGPYWDSVREPRCRLGNRHRKRARARRRVYVMRRDAMLDRRRRSMLTLARSWLTLAERTRKSAVRFSRALGRLAPLFAPPHGGGDGGN